MRAQARLCVRGQSRRRGSVGALAATTLALLVVPCQPASATVYFCAATTAQTGAGASTLTLALPTGAVAGDVLVATVQAEGSTAVTAPAGWSASGLFAGTSPVGYTGLYFHVAGSSEPSSYSWSLGGSRKAVGSISAYVGVEGAAPIETAATKSSGNNGTSDSAPSITTTVAGTMVLLAFGALDSAGSFTITPPSGTSARASVFTSGAGSVVGGDSQDFTQASAGATGTKTFKTSASLPWAALTAALKPGPGSLVFDLAPALPSLPTVALNGSAQSASAQMSGFAVDDTTGSGAGWNVTVSGNSVAGKSAQFKQFCANGGEPCGSDAANSYVSGGYTLPSGSLQLSTSGASWSTSGGSGAAPAFQCNSSSCPLDTAGATKIVSASGAGGPWSASGFGSQSLALSVPTTAHMLPAHEVYRVDLLWTLSSGP